MAISWIDEAGLYTLSDKTKDTMSLETPQNNQREDMSLSKNTQQLEDTIIETGSLFGHI